MIKQLKSVSPFSTGAGGKRFELLVATAYLVHLLRGESARGIPGTASVVEVRLQQRLQGYPVDDVVVLSSRGSRQSKLALQVKHALRFTANPLFCKVMEECWRHFKEPVFNRQSDFVGVAIGEGSNILKVRTHIQELLSWAQTHRTSQSFYVQVGKFKAKQQILNEISAALDSGIGRHIGNKALWSFLSRFVVLPFDFDSAGSRDSTDCWNSLRAVVPRRAANLAKALFDGLYGLVSRYSAAGGEIDYDAIQNELEGSIPLGRVVPLRTTRAILIRQVSNQLIKEKKSRKYIPDVFTAIDSVKDDARYFSHPIHFAQKPVEALRAIDTSFLDQLHSRFHIPAISLKLPRGFRTPTHLGQVPTQCYTLRTYFEELATNLYDVYFRENWESLRKQLPADTCYIFDDAKYTLMGPGVRIHRELNKITKALFLMEARVFLITSRAGRGKTNFVCDFADNFLLLHRIPCLLLTGRDFRSVPANQITDHIAKLIRGQDSTENLDEALVAVDYLCKETNAPFVVIFDGINEHPEIGHFSDALEKAIERLLSFPYVKVIVTCRSEYFSERFSNLKTATFSDFMHEVPEIHRKMPERHQRRMMKAYFRFFKIEPIFMSSIVRETLRKDPLLLRFFCEAYGDPDARDSIMLPAMADVYRDVVFREYLKKKLDEVAARQSPGSGVGIPLSRQYKDVLKCIVLGMVNRFQFTDIPISIVNTSLKSALAELIAEDLFVRKDLVERKSILDSDAEVINFTFDEFRDYLITDHLLNVILAKEGEDKFREKLSDFTGNKCPVAEGVRRFVFYAAKRQGGEQLLTAIASMPWYNTVFLQCIFSVEESCVTDSDIQHIKEEFSCTPDKAQKILLSLIHRWDTVALPRLNINILFSIIDGLRDETFEQLIQPIFYNPMHHFPYIPKAPYDIERFVSDIRSIVMRSASEWDTQYMKLVEFLVYLFGIKGSGYDFPAYSLFQGLSVQRPQEAVEILLAHTNIGITAIRARIWRMLTELVNQGINMPESLVDQAIESLCAAEYVNWKVLNEMGRFLSVCRDKLGMQLPDNIVLKYPQYTIYFDSPQ